MTNLNSRTNVLMSHFTSTGSNVTITHGHSGNCAIAHHGNTCTCNGAITHVVDGNIPSHSLFRDMLNYAAWLRYNTYRRS